MKVFISYIRDDIEEFKIDFVAEWLESQEQIDTIFYWENDTSLNLSIDDYKESKIQEADVIVVFCSKNIQKISQEIEFAKILGKIIVPIYKNNQENIPELELIPELESIPGIEFNSSNFDTFKHNLYTSIVEKHPNIIKNDENGSVIAEAKRIMAEDEAERVRLEKIESERIKAEEATSKRQAQILKQGDLNIKLSRQQFNKNTKVETHDEASGKYSPRKAEIIRKTREAAYAKVKVDNVKTSIEYAALSDDVVQEARVRSIKIAAMNAPKVEKDKRLKTENSIALGEVTKAFIAKGGASKEKDADLISLTTKLQQLEQMQARMTDSSYMTSLDDAEKGRLIHYSKEEKPLFVGHYWLRGEPAIVASNVACLDYSAVNSGKLVAYRFNTQEPQLNNLHFIFVDTCAERI